MDTPVVVTGTRIGHGFHASIRAFLGALVWPAVVLSLALGGCGGGGGGGGASEPPTQTLPGNFFPMAAGDRWMLDAGIAQPLTVEVTGTRRIDGQDAWVVLTRDPVSGDSETVYRVSASGVWQVPGAQADSLTLAIGPVELMRFPLVVGASFEQINKTVSTGEDYDGDGRAEMAEVRSSVQVVGTDTVVTPAGSFTGCAHLRTNLRVTLRLTAVPESVVVDTTVDDWYAPGVGPVRSTIQMRTDGFTDTETLVLKGYRVGSLRSDHSAPVVLSRMPEPAAMRAAPDFVRIVFDKPLDAASTVGALVLLDALDQPLPGTLERGSDSLTFWPAAPMVSGAYRVEVASSVTDWFGNLLAGDAGWRFGVDADGPEIVAVSPPLGALDVPLDVHITVRFSEAIDPASVSAQTVALRGPAGDVPVLVTVQGDTVTVAPTVALQRDTEYHLGLDAYGGPVRDLYGNPVWLPTAARFTTDPGRFGAALPLPQGLTAEVVGVVDVDGDGRLDVIAAVGHSFNPDWAHRVAVLRQQPDGRLAAAPQWVATRGDYVCRPSSVAVGDVDGDGAPELLLALNGCGIEIFKTDAAVGLRAAGWLDAAQSYLVRLGDFNGDGRLDVLSVGWSDSTARLWLQSAAGVLLPAASPAVEYAGWGHLAVGDLNGDGRLDFAVTSEQGDTLQQVAVVLQQADGSFAPAAYLVADSTWRARGVVIGDIDGDGRAELLASSRAFIAVWRLSGDGTWLRVADLATADGAGPLALADINGDGRLDLAVARTGGYQMGVFLQQPAGGLGPEALYSAYAQSGHSDVMALADVTGDGRTDIVLQNAVLVQRPVGLFAQGPRWVPTWLRP